MENQYSDSDRSNFDIIKRDRDFVIFRDDRPMITAGGNEFSHPDERFLKNILANLQSLASKPEGKICPSMLFSFQLDHAEKGEDFILPSFEELAARDIFIRMKTGNPMLPGEQVRKGNEDNEDNEENEEILQTLFLSLSSVLQALNGFIEEHISRVEEPGESDHPFLLLLRQQYVAMGAERKAATQLLCFMHDAGIVLPLLFADGKLSCGEYARGLRALYLRKSFSSEKINYPQTGFPYGKVIPDNEMILSDQSLRRIFHDASEVADYLSFFSRPPDPVNLITELIAGGEGANLEFKSTLRWDLKAGKTNPAVERACLKTVCAFLNSSGGVLLIGIRDDGTTEGIESDRFVNEDKFLLHLWTLIRTCLGRDVSPYIQTHLEKKDEKTVCIASVARSPRPVFLRQPGFDEEFYIRLGPGSASLDISEALKYIADRFS
ncbi:MAG: ATP-binding protein [Bacteroidetes bacterium]|nr:ATP-binding protein [Bacteroidota bacterium]